MTDNAKTIDLLGIGNAIVDILAYKDVAFLEKLELVKGSMSLVDAEMAGEIYKLMGASTECSGGSCANTAAGYAMLGGSAAFVGKVKHDAFGRIFRSDIRKSGVQFESDAPEEGAPTAHCLVMVTEETNQQGITRVERTMVTHLGIAGQISDTDIDEAQIKAAKLLYFEGYLWDSPSAREAINVAMDMARAHGTEIAFSLSDPFCVQRHKADFLELLEKVDIFFANEHEIEALMDEKDLRKILAKLSQKRVIAAITRSEKGSTILSNGEMHVIDPVKVETVFDVTGAGDLYASGFLYGYLNGMGLEKAGKLGSLCAAEVIQYLGGRPATRLSDLLEKL